MGALSYEPEPRARQGRQLCRWGWAFRAGCSAAAGGEEPDVVFQLILDSGQLEPMLKRQEERMKDFEPIMAHMSTLIRGFERGRYEEVKHFENGDRIGK